MPKPHKSAASQTLFSISPWQSRSEKRENAAKSGETDYIVVHEELMKPTTTANHPSKADSSPHQPDQVIKSQKTALPPQSGGWRTKRVKQSEQLEQGDPLILDLNTDLRSAQLHADLNTTKTPPVPLADNSNSNTTSLVGTAFFVLLGGSRIVGNFILLDNPSIKYPLHGREVTSYRECTRDPEWSLVKLHLLNLPVQKLPRELVLVAERTGGDAMKLRCPVDWQGDELEVFAAEEKQRQLQNGDGDGGDGSGFFSESGSHGINGLELEFEYHSLLTDAAADAELAKVMPGAVGMDAMINIGPMKLTWKQSGI